MPFISVKTNAIISLDQEIGVKERLGMAITAIEGKTEDWLMVCIEDGCHLYFHGDGSVPCAMVELKIFGTASEEEFEEMTSRITDILTVELEIPADRIYVKYEECPNWGWSGHNF